jgi:hypothetical protein
VADAVFDLAQDPVDGTATYHIVAGPHATTVGRIIELAVKTVGRRPPVVLPPRLFRHAVYPVLVRTSPRREGLKRTNAFFPYFAMDVRYDDSRARTRLARAGVQVPPIDSYFHRLIDFADSARWGRAPVTRAQAQRLAGGDGTVRETRDVQFVGR